MFEAFSAGYYVGRFYVEPHGGDHAVMDRDQHEEANEQVYATGEGVERVDHPLVVKVDESHFPVLAAEDVPPDTLAVPDADATRIDDLPAVKAVMVAKADRAAQLLDWFTPYTLTEPDYA